MPSAFCYGSTLDEQGAQTIDLSSAKRSLPNRQPGCKRLVSAGVETGWQQSYDNNSYEILITKYHYFFPGGRSIRATILAGFCEFPAECCVPTHTATS